MDKYEQLIKNIKEKEYVKADDIFNNVMNEKHQQVVDELTQEVFT